MKKIGVLELLTGKATNYREYAAYFLLKKQYISITPQAISYWCRRMGHDVYYATYYGIGDPQSKLPDDLDIVFISTPTHLSTFAYALAKIYRIRGVRTVIGGPHAKSYPQDCQRYYDLVVLECNESLIQEIINDEFAPGSIISSPKAYDEPPTIEERLPEIKASAFIGGRSHWGSSIPILASVGCPYSCNFCIDWNNRYRVLSSDRLAADLRFAGKHLAHSILYFHDPNFGVRFDETMQVFEETPPTQRNQYIVESSLKLLNPERLQRLRDTNCLAMAPGIESWNGYSNKAGVGMATGQEKLDQVVAQMHTLYEYVPYLQANLIMGLDVDSGDEPFNLTRQFLEETPFVWPQINMPMAFGGTPLFDTFLREGRILAKLPFIFYRQPYLTTILKHYNALEYLQKMIDLYTLTASAKMLRRRLRTSHSVAITMSNLLRTLTIRNEIAELRAIVQRLQEDAQMRAFHEGDSDRLPDFYVHTYHSKLGKFAELVPIEESTPILTSTTPIPLIGGTAKRLPAF